MASSTIARPSRTTGEWATRGLRPKTRATTSSTPRCTSNGRTGALTARTAQRTAASYKVRRAGALATCASRVRMRAVTQMRRTLAYRAGRLRTVARCARVWRWRFTRHRRRRQRRLAWRSAARHRRRRPRRRPCRRRASSFASTLSHRSTGGSTRVPNGALSCFLTWRQVQWSPRPSLTIRALKWATANIGMASVRACSRRRRTSMIGIAA